MSLSSIVILSKESSILFFSIENRAVKFLHVTVEYTHPSLSVAALCLGGQNECTESPGSQGSLPATNALCHSLHFLLREESQE